MTPQCAAPAPWRVVTVEKLTHEQFNNTLPSLATDCASCTGWKSEGGVLLCSKCTRWQGNCDSFAEWAVGDFNRQKETVLCDKLTAGSRIPYGVPVRVIRWEPETQRVIYLREGYEHECFSPLEQFRRKFGKSRSVMSTELTGYLRMVALHQA